MKHLLTTAAALVLGATGQAAAQDYSATLQDGKVVTIPHTTAACGTPRNRPDERFDISLAFGCDDAISGSTGDGAFLISREPGQTTPREYLMRSAATYLPQGTEEERAQLLSEMTMTLESGVFKLLCLLAENEERTGGEATCILDQPRTQVVIGGSSYDIDQAMAVIAMFMHGVTIR